MSILSTAAGAVIVLAVLQDVFTTVLAPSTRLSLLRQPVSRAVWELFRGVGQRLAGHRRRWVLALAGPVIITVNIATWVLLLIAGFALLYQPALGDEIRAASGLTDTSWTTAAYYSGYSGTTLGVGDVVATTGVYRLLTVTQAALGFAGITMAITYFLSVYGNLASRNVGAQALHHRTNGTGDAAEFLVGLADGGDLAGGRSQLGATAGYLREVHQSLGQYPVLRYFHYPGDQHALPRILLVSLDASALLRTAVDHDAYPTLLASRSLSELDQANADLLADLGGPADERPDEARAQALRQRYQRGLDVLQAAGVSVAPDPAAYVAERSRWDHRLRFLSDQLAYPWDDIDVATPPSREERSG